MSDTVDTLQKMLNMMDRFLDIQDRMMAQLERVCNEVQELRDRLDEQEGLNAPKHDRLN